MVENLHGKRLEKFREHLEEGKLDGFLIAVPENRYYLSGFEAEDLLLTESSGVLLITPTDQFLLTDSRYQQAAAKEASGFEVAVYKEGLDSVLGNLLKRTKIRRLGVESHYLTYQKFQEVEACLSEAIAGGEVVPVDGLVERMRLVKDPQEIDRIKASLGVTEQVLERVWEALEPGQSEQQVAWAIESGIRQAGAEAVSFPPIVASGPNAALPHAVPTQRTIGVGETVVLDLGSKLDLYCSDMTRTWVSADADGRLVEIYKLVHEAQTAAQETIKAGLDSYEADGVARKIIADAGYGEYFGHGLGHGVGLAVHEKPGFGKKSRMILEENMVVTVEPGIYLPGLGGVRLENMVRVTATGCEVLNQLDLYYRW